MKNTMMLVLVAFLLPGCGGGTDATVATTDEDKRPWSQFATQAVADYYRQNPESAVNAGLHEYDGQMSDFSLASVKEYNQWLQRTRNEAANYSELVGIEAFERDYLITILEGEQFWINESDFLTTNPIVYASNIRASIYVDREYAPSEVRIKAYTDYVSHIPGFLQTMQQNLQPPLPAPYVDIGQRIFAGLAEYLNTTVPALFAMVEGEHLQSAFVAANTAAVEAVRQSADWLEGQKATATNDYALGEDRFLGMLSATQDVDITLADLKAAGQLDLDRNLELLSETCAEFAPEASIKACVRRVQSRKPPEGAVGGALRQLPSLRKFIEDNELVSIPGTEEALVDEAPPHRRFNAAYIEIPGPFESNLPSVYYIAPPDPSWSEEDRLAYVPGETSLLATSVHEVWPGHFLQFLHANRVENNIGRHFKIYTYVEGWAHYTEQMMVDAGLGDGGPEVRIGQLLQALLRNARYMSAIGLHAEGMTVKESQAMFEEKAFQDYGNASQQAFRGTYDPGYLNYTLGKLMINKLRDDWTSGRGGQESWGQFHDLFLSYGAPPIPLIRRQLLGEDFGGDTALLPH